MEEEIKLRRKIACLVFIYLFVFLFVSKSKAGNVIDDDVAVYCDSDYMYGELSEYKIVIEINDENDMTDYNYISSFYMASNSILDNVKFNANQDDCQNFYYNSKSNSSIYVYTTGNVDTKLEVYLGEVLIDENDDTEISEDDIDYNAQLYVDAEKYTTYKIVLKTYSEGVVTLCVNQ